MADPARKIATYEDVLNAPEDQVAQVIDGELHVQPRPASRHVRGSSRLSGWADHHFDDRDDGPGDWVIMQEPELHLGRDILVPDVAGWRRTRMPIIPDVPFFDLAPDWICEGLSPSTERIDRGRKMAIYAREGVRHAWLFEAKLKTLEVYRLHETNWLRIGFYSGDEVVHAEPFESAALTLTRLWIP